MKRRHTALILFATLLFALSGKTQGYKTALEKISALPVEKLYIHYDKEHYVSGETVWFKAYFYSNGKPSALSSNFYLQLADNKGQIVNESRYAVVGAVAKGSIVLPDSLPQGNYYLRGFTPVMLNGDESMIYKRNIFVFRPNAVAVTSATGSQNVSLSFFPESGHLVDGILTVVGFKATDQTGMPVEVNGIIKTAEGTTIASFKSVHDGIGKVQFKPQTGKQYVAEVETAAGKRTYPLPEVRASGINLKVQDEKGGKKFQLSRTEKEKGLFDQVTVVAEINNYIVYETDIAFEDYPSVVGHLVTDSLPTGILHFTVFNKDGIPIAERLTFVDNGEYRSEASLVMEKKNLENRAENKVGLQFATAIQRSCSISITDFSGPGFGDDDNIYSRLLLTGDLKGYVHNPAWYFMHTGDSVKQALDNLMLTQGWSRYDWKKLLAGEIPSQTILDPGYITITGRVVNESNKDALSGGLINFYLQAEDSVPQNLEAIPDDAGRFRLDSLMFNGKSQLFYTYKDGKGKLRPALIILDEDPVEKRAAYPAGLTLVSRNTVAINKSDIETRFNYEKGRLDPVKELENVEINVKSNKKPIDIVNEKYTSGVFRAEGKVNIDNINNPANDKSLNVVDYIKNRIQQIELQGGKFVNRKNMSLMTGQKWVVGLFLNEQPTEMGLLRTVRINDVALIKFYEAGFVGVGSGSPGGALAVYTKEKMAPEQKPEKFEFVEYKGYAISKQFYQPDYNNKNARHPASDRRTTLYWNPDVMLESGTNELKFEFFNNDFSRQFKIVVEGFDAEGKLIHMERIVGN